VLICSRCGTHDAGHLKRRNALNSLHCTEPCYIIIETDFLKTRTAAVEMEGLSGFDRAMVKRLESSALAFYELKHQQQLQQQHQEVQCGVRGVCTEADKTKTITTHQRCPSDASSSSSSSSTSSSPVYTKHFASDAMQMCDDVTRELRLPGQTSDAEAGVPTTMSLTHGDGGDRSPRTTADGPTGTTSNGSISFSISRILGHDSTSAPAADSRRPKPVHRRSVPSVHAAERSGMASPDSSCRVAGDDVDHDVKTLNDSDDEDDLNDNDVTVKLQTQSPLTDAAAVVCGDTLHRLSWLHCTRYKPPKLPSKNNYYFQK